MKTVYKILFVAVIIAIAVIVYVLSYHSGNKIPKQTAESAIVLSYLSALYPTSDLKSLKPDQVLDLYDSLDWYYLPLVRAPHENRRGPLNGPYDFAETQWFMADGADCGDYSSTPGNFTCSVFGGACDSWEFGKSGDGGRPYQQICFIRPYGRRQGTPNNCYIECVAFVCESLGRMLLNAGNGCGTVAPTWQQFLSGDTTLGAEKCDCQQGEACQQVSGKNVCCPQNAASCDGVTPGCKIQSFGNMSDTCCWDFSKNQSDPSVCEWPNVCLAKQVGDRVYDNYCGIPNGFISCDVTSNCQWKNGDNTWLENVAQSDNYWKMVDGLKSCKPVLDNGTAPIPRLLRSASKTMFYWCKGYGKFLNMGKTGVYFSYFHFLLTCPKVDTQGRPMRWSYPQIIQVATDPENGNGQLLHQLQDLMSGKLKDRRKYLQGYVTTLRGDEYTPKEGIMVNNKMQYAGQNQNVNGMFNPLDDDNLRNVDKYTVTKYYNPRQKIRNPQYNKTIKFTGLQSVYLQQGMHIYGATGTSTEKPMLTLQARYQGTWPFGVFFAGSNLGGSVYQMVEALGWNSIQLTQMPTGAGGKKYCNYPEYDYEIVYIASKKDVCGGDMKMVDITGDLQTYQKYGYVHANKVNAENFDANVMKLTERNVPDNWKGALPNAMHYKQPPKFIKDTTQCPYEDSVYRSYNHQHDSGINTCGMSYMCN
jgi:hypothetical protein